MGIGKSNSDDHYIYYCGLESLRRHRAVLRVNKSPKYSIWVQPQKWQNDLGLFLRKTIQNHSNANLCLNRWCQRSCNWLVLWKPTRSSRTSTKKRLDHKGLECKRKKSRDIHNNRQVCPWSTKWSRAMANIVLSREHTGHSKHPFPTTQETMLHMDVTR